MAERKPDLSRLSDRVEGPASEPDRMEGPARDSDRVEGPAKDSDRVEGPVGLSSSMGWIGSEQTGTIFHLIFDFLTLGLLE